MFLCLHIPFRYHSVERVTQNTVAVFTPRQSASVLGYLQDTYYRHYKLFKHNFTLHRPVLLQQVLGGIGPCETPRTARPLHQAANLCSEPTRSSTFEVREKITLSVSPEEAEEAVQAPLGQSRGVLPKVQHPAQHPAQPKAALAAQTTTTNTTNTPRRPPGVKPTRSASGRPTQLQVGAVSAVSQPVAAHMNP